jgi:hypothetical protein
MVKKRRTIYRPFVQISLNSFDKHCLKNIPTSDINPSFLAGVILLDDLCSYSIKYRRCKTQYHEDECIKKSSPALSRTGLSPELYSKLRRYRLTYLNKTELRFQTVLFLTFIDPKKIF